MIKRLLIAGFMIWMLLRCRFTKLLLDVDGGIESVVVVKVDIGFL